MSENCKSLLENLAKGSLVCKVLLTSCPRLKSLSVLIPQMILSWLSLESFLKVLNHSGELKLNF